MKRSHKDRSQIKDANIGLKLAGELVAAIDAEAEREGLTRSAIVRRVLLRHYRPPHTSEGSAHAAS